MLIRFLPVAILSLTLAGPASAFDCRWADTPITIDGKADDPAWKHAQVIEQFRTPSMKEPREPKTKTKARLLWDREYLYFFAEMVDGDLYADVKEKDGQTWDNDVFELFFKPADDKPGYYEFQVNAAGTVLDIFFPRRNAGGVNRFKRDGEFHIDAKVVLDGTLNKWSDTDKGWSVEGRIAWKDFLRTGGRPTTGETWKFVLCRYDYSVDFEGPELSWCAPKATTPHPDFHHYEDYATLTFVGPDKNTSRPRGIDKLIPVTTSTVLGSPDPPPPYVTKRLFPKLKMNFPICVVPQPGSDLLLVIDQPWSYGPTRIGRIRDHADNAEIETLFKTEDTAYDICFHPKFTENGYVYVGGNGNHPSGKKRSRITRYVIDRKAPYALDVKSATVIIDWVSDGHNGAAVCFGNDGMMYVTSGDGTSDSDTNVVGQDMTTILAKVLRIDVDHPSPGKHYSVPKDNPFVDLKGAVPETWAYGVRNPWRICCDRVSGQIWLGQNGQDLWEQAFLVKKGDNYGWSVTEGSHPFYPNRKTGPTPIVKPTVEHHHSEFRSLTGGFVYRGAKFPDLHGAYIYGDYSTGKIWGVKHDGTKIEWQRELCDSHKQLTWMGPDTKGEIIIADHRGQDGGAFYTFEALTKSQRNDFPRTLSASGLFDSVKDHRMKPGVIPYSVNAPFWSDGALKQRWIVLPGEAPTIDFTHTRGWNFPDKTLIVKSFAMDMTEGAAASRRWIETRFLTKQDGEWYGYSYQWNDDQTDATLVDRGGTDRDLRIKTGVGERVQTWRYPSRAECMVCHSRAANYVLGLCELQMNKDHDYGGVVDNQLRVLEHLGVLRGNNAFEDMKNELREDAKAKGWDEKKVDEFVAAQTATRLQREAKVGTMLGLSPEKHKRLVDPYDSKQDLNKRARSFLHTNCAMCHVEAGGGNAQIDLEFTTAKDKMKLFDVKPVHHTFGLPDAKLIAPGHPERSVLLKRVAHRDAGFMPPVATRVVDEAAARMLREWIEKMK